MSAKNVQTGLLKDFLETILQKAGMPKPDAVIMAEGILKSDVMGFDSHGINRLKPVYLDRIKDGIINPVTNITIVREGPTTAVIDGNNGMGHVVSYHSMLLAIKKARQYGMGMVVVRNSNHYGFAGFYPLLAVNENMIGITGTNARPSVAPTFGVEGMLGTNPLTFGFPTDEDFPFLLDCATSTIQRGKVELHARYGKELKQGWVINNQGISKVNPKEVLDEIGIGQAALIPLGGAGEDMGGYKGYGYATVVEILSAALQQGAFLHLLSGIENGKKVPLKTGHFFIAIEIGAFTEPERFRETTGTILRQLRTSRKVPGQDRIYTAGEKEFEISRIRSQQGVPIEEDLLAELRGLCKEYGLEEYLPHF
ncbi:MAG TPA: Ldh family oxidoreductase [Bacteroidales bacterium]|nr:Ldh family oxidoreductase [Bacteroidales bacterium]